MSSRAIRRARAVTRITVSSVTSSATAAPAVYRLEADGDIFYNVGGAGSPSDQGDWIIPRAHAGGNFEVAATIISGTVSTGDVTGAYFALSADRAWTRAGSGAQTCTIQITIRRVGTSNVLATAQIVLERDN